MSGVRDTRPSKLRASLDSDEVLACPECDSSDIKGRKWRSRPDGSPSEAWYCTTCGDHFDEPVIREAQAPGRNPSGLAKKLWDMDPDEVTGT